LKPIGGHPVGSKSAARAAREVLAQAAATAAATAERAGIDIRPLETLEQMTEACSVLERVWGVRPGEVFDVQPHLLRALGHGGNYLVGAYPLGGGEMIGASSAFFTEPLGAAMHSHITGVLPGTAGRGVGTALKWHQRQWALERGLTRITWTYDPLIARNSFFNLTRLGGRPETYFVDFYGAMNDGPNRGQPSDRVQIGWDLAAPATIDCAGSARLGNAGNDGPAVDELIAAGAAVVLAPGPAGEPVSDAPASSGGRFALIGIPPDIERVRMVDAALALTWRYQLRAALALMMADKSWLVTGFARSGWYLLERRG
jgi:predicted GNAT superfamily acetyltransferase